MAQLTTAGQEKLLAALAQASTQIAHAGDAQPDVRRLTEERLTKIGLPRHSQARKQAAEDLFAAADLLERPYGWTQHTMHRTVEVIELPPMPCSYVRAPGHFLTMTPVRRTMEAHCAMGAVQSAVIESISGTELHRMRLAASVLESTLPPGATVPAWNDWPSRTQSEVVAHMRAVARRLADD